MGFLLGILIGLAAGVLYHVLRTREMARANEALMDDNKALWNGEAVAAMARQCALFRDREIAVNAELIEALERIERLETINKVRAAIVIVPSAERRMVANA